MALISLQNISIAFGGPPLLNDLNLQIERKQRICLLGRNGAGKSTLMKIISGEIAADGGVVHKEQQSKIAYCPQEVPQELSGTVFEIIASGLGERGHLLLKYEAAEKNIMADADAFSQLQVAMEAQNGWAVLEEIREITSRMSLNPDWEYATLSGGQKRRVLLAAALVSKPDLLLLDEPTNHLDMNAIAWLEDFLLQQNMTLLFVTHDRMFLRRLATRIIELDRGDLVDWSCDYDTFLKRKQAVLDTQQKEWEKFDKKLAEEEVWIRKGIKARRTRNEGRVRALKKMREERKRRREREGMANLTASQAEKSGKLVIEATNISHQYDDQPLISDFSIRIMRGDKIGIIGPNGCGKTTLVNILLKKLPPRSGTVRHGERLAIVYSDQMRGQLDESKNAWENVAPNGDTVKIDGNDRHILSYLQDFLFTPDRAKLPVGFLSGGERNRLLLAKLFTQPANLLVLDEPTNDLDAETLELLEALLVDFSGTLLLISHDRAFLNNVVTSTLAFSDDKNVREFVGGYDDWFAQTQKQNEAVAETPKMSKKESYRAAQKAKRKKKLSFNEARELKALPALIESLEAKQAAVHQKMADPDFYREKAQVVDAKSELETLEAELVKAYERWEYLESIEAE